MIPRAKRKPLDEKKLKAVLERLREELRKRINAKQLLKK